MCGRISNTNLLNDQRQFIPKQKTHYYGQAEKTEREMREN